MTPEETYTKWHASLKSPDDSIFYYHKCIDSILLSLAIFVIASRPVSAKLGKAKMLNILHLQVPDLITTWIDEDNDTFAQLFPLVMTVAESYTPAAIAAEEKFPSYKKTIRTMAYLLANACGAGGDMEIMLADELLDDLSTDGKNINSDKIKKFGEDLLFLTKSHGIDIPTYLWLPLIGFKNKE